MCDNRIFSPCQYTHDVECRLLGPHDTLPFVLMHVEMMQNCKARGGRQWL